MNNKINIDLPVSKSIGARYLVATYFAGTLPTDPYFDDNDDLMVLQQALLSMYSDEEPIDYGNTQIDVHASGTAFRFVTAVCASTSGADFVITGTPRLCSRPMKPLIDVLRDAGAEIQTMGSNETGPYRVSGKHLTGGEFFIAGDISSQFISALMLAAPTWENGMKLNFTTRLVSRPYIEMTASVMKKFGIEVNLTDDWVQVKKGKYKGPKDFKVEADWSSASFFYEAAALSSRKIEINNLIAPRVSIQGDSACDDIFSKLGVKSVFDKNGVTIQHFFSADEYIEVDFKNMPDLVLPYAVAAMLSGIRFKFREVGNLRIKESDRVASLINEAAKLGFKLKYKDECIEWNGDITEPLKDPLIETYDDHRVAMAFAIAVFKVGLIRIFNPEVVEKSFANFWIELSKFNLSLEHDGDIMIVKLNIEEKS